MRLWRLASTIAIGNLGANAVPITVAGLEKFEDVSTKIAGLMGSGEFLAAALTCMAAPRIPGALTSRITVWLMFFLGLVASIVTALHIDLRLTFAARILVGIASGYVLSLALVYVSQLENTVRGYALAAVVASIASAAGIGALSWLGTRYGPASLFLITAGVWAIASLFNVGPDKHRSAPAAYSGIRHINDADQYQWKLHHFWVVMCAGAVGLVQVTVWSQAEFLGRDVGLAPAVVSMALSISLLCGLLGMGLAAAMSESIKPITAMLFSLVAMGLSSIAVWHSNLGILFFLGLAGWGIFLSLLTPFIIGHASSLDPSGRLSSAVASGMMLGAAGGPYAGAVVMASFKPAASAATIGLSLIAAIFVLLSNRGLAARQSGEFG